MYVHADIHAELVKCGVRLAATLPDDWTAPLIRKIAADLANSSRARGPRSRSRRNLQRRILRRSSVGRRDGRDGPAHVHGGTRDAQFAPSNSGLLHRQPAWIDRRSSRLSRSSRPSHARGPRRLRPPVSYDRSARRHRMSAGRLRSMSLAETPVRPVLIPPSRERTPLVKTREAMRVLAEARGEELVVCALGKVPR